MSVEFYKKLIITFIVVIIIALIASISLWIKSNTETDKPDEKVDEKNVKQVVEQSNKKEIDIQIDKKDSQEIDENLDIKDSKEKNDKLDKSKEEKDDKKKIVDEKHKKVYLTFEDSPSVNTSSLIAILKNQGVNGTFFFNTSDDNNFRGTMKEAIDADCEIGIFTSDKKTYQNIYKSLEVYKNDFNQSVEKITLVTGKKPEIVRLPGGSKNGFNKNTRNEIIEFIKEQDVDYFDWNVCDDSLKSMDLLVHKATKIGRNKETVVVLLHDNGNKALVEGLEKIIKFYKDNGYEFEVLSKETKPIKF